MRPCNASYVDLPGLAALFVQLSLEPFNAAVPLVPCCWTLTSPFCTAALISSRVLQRLLLQRLRAQSSCICNEDANQVFVAQLFQTLW